MIFTVTHQVLFSANITLGLQLLAGTIECVKPGCLALEDLSIRGCTAVQDEGIADLFKACENLRSLNFKLCDQLTDAAFTCLQSLKRDVEHLDLQGKRIMVIILKVASKLLMSPSQAFVRLVQISHF